MILLTLKLRLIIYKPKYISLIFVNSTIKNYYILFLYTLFVQPIQDKLPKRAFVLSIHHKLYAIINS